MGQRQEDHQYWLSLTGLWRIAAIGCLISVTVLSLLPGEDVPKTSLTDKQSHFIAYASLCFLFSMGWVRWATWKWMIMAAFYGVFIEFCQQFTSRTPDPLDALANSLGALLGLALVVIIRSGLKSFGRS
ncbi:VanZ family protein [Pokkaliibacter sp. CJK22405]|uniref:VanZ family protein n=1 Tax=Pokkaliibacter sp. CJK22405 TaxID=3384615 RepID=UPI00398478AE